MEVPTADIDGCASAHERLSAVVHRIADREIREASALPDWTVGHVLTHLARNADAMCRRIDGAINGELVEQYPGGPEGREAEISVGARRGASEIRADVLVSARRLGDRFASLPGEVWDRPVLTVTGGEHPVASLPFRRWREVEVHLVDLGLGSTTAGWSDAFVERALPGLVERLGDRTDRRALMAWLLGRGPAPPLDPWA